MATVYRPQGRKKYVIEFFDEHGRRRKKTGATDKGVTQRIARDLENRVALRREGLIDPTAESHANHEAKPLSSHLDDFRKALADKGNTNKHIDLFVARARRVVDIAKQDRLSDLTASRVQAALAALRGEGRSLATCNHHRAAIRGFSRWLWRDGRLSDDPLLGVSGFNAKEDRRHDRRTLGVDDLRQVIEAAERGEPYRRMSGPARALCYRLAVATGLRYSEIKSLTPELFNGASVTIQAAYAKNGQTDTLPLPPDVASDLSAWIQGKPDGEPIFPLPGRGADMLKIDLESAGLPYRDSSGLVFDFHSLRCQTATLADQAGCSPRVVQRLMRHSTLELTGRYTRPRAVDLEDAAHALPTLRPRLAECESLAATGTDDSAPSATQNATTTEDEDPNPLDDKVVASSRARNHNPRVGGSSPSAAICDRPSCGTVAVARQSVDRRLVLGPAERDGPASQRAEGPQDVHILEELAVA
jgi:integrase